MLALVALLKPLPALALGLLAWRSGGPARLLAAGLVCAATGDAILLRAGDGAFLCGMLAFVAMHACYIAAFSRCGSRRPYTAILAALYALVALSVLAMLAPKAGAFALPLVAYSVVLVTMASFATRSGAMTAAGGALFVTSDMLLAFARFWPASPLAPIDTPPVVLATYYAAQMLIVAGILRDRATGS